VNCDLWMEARRSPSLTEEANPCIARAAETENLDGAVFCQRCGIRLAAGAAASANSLRRLRGGGHIRRFWRRVAAFLLDGILITAALGILGAPSGCGAAGLSTVRPLSEVSRASAVCSTPWPRGCTSRCWRAPAFRRLWGSKSSNRRDRSLRPARLLCPRDGPPLRKDPFVDQSGSSVSRWLASRRDARRFNDILAECVVIRKN